MEVFSLNQRWISEGEPELGVGIVTDTARGRVHILFPISGETRLYSMENAPLRRVLFKPGDTIIDSQNRQLLVEKVREENHLMMYYGEGRSVSEADLGNVSVKQNAEDRLLAGDVDPPELFALRRQTLHNDLHRRISPVNGFVGGSIDLIPHQLYIAHEVSSRYAPRVLLSDEVGLGKTIEACLILHRLLLSGRISRVLILVPETLIHQWFVELLRRFNLWFQIFDEEHCVAIEEGAPEGNPFLDGQLIICSTDFLAGSELRASQALSAEWDMLIVDEAHHLKWSVEEASQEYLIVELLSKVAKDLLLLTATPEQLGLESHFARLRLLDPDRYADFDSFKNESSDQKKIVDLVEHLSQGKSLSTDQQKLLEALLGKERLNALAQNKGTASNQIIEDLLDQHGPGRVIFRNTRSTMSGFPKRIPHLIPLKPKNEHDLWFERVSKEFSTDIGVSSPTPISPEFWFEEDPRVEWLIRFMEKIDPEKVLLICRSKEKVLALEEALRTRAHFKVGIFHEDLTIIQRDRNAAWFSEQDGARLLICSEIGSEGRNFQFAHHLVLFDLPFHPELLEQRIGRLDRIGQTEDIKIHVPYIVDSPQEVLVRWYHEGLNAFEKNLEGGNKLISEFGEQLLEVSLSASSPNHTEEINSLITNTATFQKELRTILADGRDRLLEMNSFRPEVADKLVEQIKKEDRDNSLETYLNHIFEHFGIEIEDLAPRTYLLHPNANNIDAFPTIPEEGISITFDSKRALSREDVSFISWDHPMATETIDMIVSSGTGNASFGILKSSGAPAILLEALFVLETVGGQNLHVDRFLPKKPLRVVIDHTMDEVTDLYPVELLNQHLKPGRIDDLLDNETLVETIIPNMIDTATQIAEELAETEIANGLKKMNLTLNHEIGRLQSLQEKNNHIRPEEIQIAREEQAELAGLIEGARVRLDGVLLVRRL